jgi:hypothetical protein
LLIILFFVVHVLTHFLGMFIITLLPFAVNEFEALLTN